MCRPGVNPTEHASPPRFTTYNVRLKRPGMMAVAAARPVGGRLGYDSANFEQFPPQIADPWACSAVAKLHGTSPSTVPKGKGRQCVDVGEDEFVSQPCSSALLAPERENQLAY